MDCSIILCQNNKYIVRDISMTLPSSKQFQEEENFTPLKPGLFFCSVRKEYGGGPHFEETWQTKAYQGRDGM
jgi:hypothetical protein